VYEFCSGFAYAPKMQPVVASRDIESLEHEPVSTAAVKSQKWFQNLKSSLIFFFSLLFFRECCRLYASVSLWIDHWLIGTLHASTVHLTITCPCLPSRFLHICKRGRLSTWYLSCSRFLLWVEFRAKYEELRVHLTRFFFFKKKTVSISSYN